MKMKIVIGIIILLIGGIIIMQNKINTLEERTNVYLIREGSVDDHRENNIFLFGDDSYEEL
jgi:hypothetical protein